MGLTKFLRPAETMGGSPPQVEVRQPTHNDANEPGVHFVLLEGVGTHHNPSYMVRRGDADIGIASLTDVAIAHYSTFVAARSKAETGASSALEQAGAIARRVFGERASARLVIELDRETDEDQYILEIHYGLSPDVDVELLTSKHNAFRDAFVAEIPSHVRTHVVLRAVPVDGD